MCGRRSTGYLFDAVKEEIVGIYLVSQQQDEAQAFPFLALGDPLEDPPALGALYLKKEPRAKLKEVLLPIHRKVVPPVIGSKISWIIFPPPE